MRLLAIVFNICVLIFIIYVAISHPGSTGTKELLIIFFMSLTPVVNLVFIFGATGTRLLAILLNICLLIFIGFSIANTRGVPGTQELLFKIFNSLTPIVNLVFIFTNKESLLGLWIETKKKKLRDELDNPAPASSDDKDS
jgi:hypothetical protein|tara:strand:- start:8315 stop:8734 length:420 start_codon:yes stop_codon:yes gene_type:complete